MKLNERQSDFAIALREISCIPETDSWGLFVDYNRALATLAEGSEVLIPPQEMQARFTKAWNAYATLWGEEYNRILRDCVGGQDQLDVLKNHPNGNKALNRIVQRIMDHHGSIVAGMTAKIPVDDILEEELGDQPSRR